MLRLFKSDEYQNDLNNQLGEDMLEKVCQMFGSSHIKNSFYHIPTSSEAYVEVNKNNPPKVPIYPPFLPSVASNAIYVGHNFDHKSRFDQDSVNAAILAPPLYAYIMSAYSSQPMSDIINSKMRIEHLNYYLRFHNSHGNTNTIKKFM